LQGGIGLERNGEQLSKREKKGEPSPSSRRERAIKGAGKKSISAFLLLRYMKKKEREKESVTFFCFFN